MNQRLIKPDPRSVRGLLAEVVETLVVVADMCAAAAVPGIREAEAEQYRRAVRSQLDVVNAILYAAGGPQRGKLCDNGAAAGTDPPRGPGRGAESRSEEEAMPIAGDQGFIDQTPTGAFDAHYGAMTAPGSDGIHDSAAGVGGGPVIGSPVVSVPYASSQLVENMPRVAVTTGDTSGMTDDMAAHASVIDGTTDAGPYMNTGAGSGRVTGAPHLNARH